VDKAGWSRFDKAIAPSRRQATNFI